MIASIPQALISLTGRRAQLDSLTKTSANITIDTSYPLDLSLPLIEAENITLNGTINSLVDPFLSIHLSRY